jgi:hypothetical protein
MSSTAPATSAPTMTTSAQRYKIPSTNAIVARVCLELLALFALGYPMLHIYVFLQGDAEPYHRGFFCDGSSTFSHYLKFIFQIF